MSASVVVFQCSAAKGELAPTTALRKAKTQQERKSWECSEVFLTGKNRSNPTTVHIPEPTQCHQALLLSVQCILATYSISLTFLLLYLNKEHL